MYGKELVGEWGPPPEGGTLPIKEKDFINQIRANCKLDLPLVNIEAENELTMVMVCGGPTAKLFLEDIRAKSKDKAKYRIFCSNKTHDWLISNEIIPDYFFMIDPKEGKVKDVQNPHKDVTYLIGICCHPKVFEALKGHNVKRVVSLSGTIVDNISDLQILAAFFDKDEYVPLEGGSMAGLRAMTLANILGYRTVEFYGFDSCFFEKDADGKPIYYSYDKDRSENILDVRCDDGKEYLSTPVFASQAREFIKWKHRLEWIKFVIFGDGLINHINKIDEAVEKPKHDLLVTPYMLEMNKRMFLKPDDTAERDVMFGSVGQEYAGRVALLAGQLAKRYGKITMLDYGCGRNTLIESLPKIVDVEYKSYDPCIDEHSKDPEPADFVVCTDVLEHTEPECRENVLDHLQKLTKKLAFISICLTPAAKNYSDGRNCHLSLLEFDIWYAKLRKRFRIIEQKKERNRRGHEQFIAVVQAKEVK
jgi:hypothetical protein